MSKWLMLAGLGLALFVFPVGAAHAGKPIIGLGGKCLTAQGGPGAPVSIVQCRPGWGNQRWDWHDANLVTDRLCLDIEGGSGERGAKTVVWTCQPGSHTQQWHTAGGAIVGYKDRCLDVEGERTDDGTPVVVWDCHGRENQQWRFPP